MQTIPCKYYIMELSFLQTETISGSLDNPDLFYSITYGPGQQRKKTEFLIDDDLQRTRTYSDLYEKEISGNLTKELHYITTGNNSKINYSSSQIRSSTFSIYSYSKPLLNPYLINAAFRFCLSLFPT